MGAALVGVDLTWEDIFPWEESGFLRGVLVCAEIWGELSTVNLVRMIVAMRVCALLVVGRVYIAHDSDGFVVRF